MKRHPSMVQRAWNNNAPAHAGPSGAALEAYQKYCERMRLLKIKPAAFHVYERNRSK